MSLVINENNLRCIFFLYSALASYVNLSLSLYRFQGTIRRVQSFSPLWDQLDSNSFMCCGNKPVGYFRKQDQQVSWIALKCSQPVVPNCFVRHTSAAQFKEHVPPSHLEGFYNQSTANSQNGGITALKSNTKSFEACVTNFSLGLMYVPHTQQVDSEQSRS